MYQILAYSKNFVFWTKFKRVFLQKKRKIKHYHWILNILINLCIKFQIKLTIFTFCIKFYPKRLFLVEHWILHIQISPGTKLHFNQTILNFGNKFTQKGYFQSKRAKVIITIEFCIFKLVWTTTFRLNW